MFSDDWFSHNIPVWERMVLPVLPQRPLRWLELGSHEGRSARWTLDNALGPSGRLVCVDMWHNPDVERAFDHNVGGRVEKVKGMIRPTLSRFVCEERAFDCVYIDGDHDAAATLESAVLSWPMIPTGGVLIFDDYRYQHPSNLSIGRLDTHFGIDAFLSAYRLRYELLHQSYQVILRKRRI